MKGPQVKFFRFQVILPLLLVLILLIILGVVFIPGILKIIIASLLVFVVICFPCFLAFFMYPDFFGPAHTKEILKKIAAGSGIILLSGIVCGVLVMATLQEATVLLTRAICPVGFTSMTTESISVPYEDENEYGDIEVFYRNTVEVTAHNDDYFYVLDEFPVFSAIVLVYLFLAVCILAIGFLINTLCINKGKPGRRFFLIPVVYLFLLLLIFIPHPVSDFFHHGIRGILYRGWTPLLYNAIEDDDLSFLDDLIHQGAHINTKNSFGETPLFMAVETGNADMVQVLFNRGARQNFKNRNGNTPLMIAVIQDEEEILQLLLENGARVTIKNKQGKTAIDLAQYEEKQGILKIFRQAGY